MGRPLCFNLGRKMLLITSLDSFPPPALFKLTDEDFAEITSKKGFIHDRYLSWYKWLYVQDCANNNLTGGNNYFFIG
jgi:hypothetical protein